MKLFRRRTPKPEEEKPPEGKPIPAEADADDAVPEGRRGLFGRRKRKAHDKPEALPLTPEEAMAPPTMEITGRRFTVVTGSARDPQAAPLELPALGKERRRGLPWQRHPDLLEEIAALVGTTATETADETSTSPDDAGELVAPLHAPPRRDVRGGALLCALLLLGAALLGALDKLGILPPALIDAWPLAVMAAGLALVPGALRRQDGGRLLGGFALMALGISAHLALANVLPIGGALAALAPTAFGAAVALRGLLIYRHASTGR